MANLEKTKADKLTSLAVKKFKSGFQFKRARMEEIEKNEEFYYGRKIKVPKGRFAVPLPTMSGFVDTLMSKIDDPPVLKFGWQDIADLKVSRKVSAFWQKDQHPNKANWALKDRWAKKQACFSGRAIYKIFAESDPQYKHYLEVVDYEDFITDPMGGGDLESHGFCGQDNIFRSESQLDSNAKAGLYNAEQVTLLKASVTDKEFKRNEDIYKHKAERLARQGLNLNNYEYSGSNIYKLTEFVLDDGGERYYILFDYFTGIWVRCELLTDVFESGLLHWVSWATHEDAFNFWSKAPCDDMRPVADAMDTLFNQELDNRYKKNFGQRAYDPAIFTEPSDLNWKPDGLVVAKASAKGVQISQGIYEFRTDALQGTIDIINYLDIYLGKKTGINAEMQGAADNGGDNKVGITLQNMQQASDRIGLHNKSYRECHLQLGLRYAWGLKEHLKQPQAIKIIGEDGIEWDEITKGDAMKAPDLDLEITGGQTEIMMNEAKSQKRLLALDRILKTPTLSARVNPDWLLEEVLKSGTYEETETKVAMSKNPANLEMMSDASNAIQEIIAGKKPKIRRTADTTFMQYILDFANDEEVELPIYKNLIAYALEHKQIVISNMIRKAQQLAFTNAQANTGNPVVPQPVSMPELQPQGQPILNNGQ